MLNVVKFQFYKYFKQKKGQLPYPKGPLAKVMLSSAILSANAVVENIINDYRGQDQEKE